MAQIPIIDYAEYDFGDNIYVKLGAVYHTGTKKLIFYGDLDIPPIRLSFIPTEDEAWEILEKYFSDLEGETTLRKRVNPRRGRGVKIYDTILAIEAVKGDDSLWPGEEFRHDFDRKSKAEIIGNPDGSLTIRSQTGKKLWKRFYYNEDEVEK